MLVPLHGCPPRMGGGLVHVLVYTVLRVQNSEHRPDELVTQDDHWPSTTKQTDEDNGGDDDTQRKIHDPR